MKRGIIGIFLLVLLVNVLGVLAVVSECSDSDHGVNYLVKGDCYYPTSSIINIDYCFNEGNQIGLLREYHCGISSGTCEYIDYKCPYGCKEGICLNDSAINCSDSDNGKDIYIKGTTSGLGGLNLDNYVTYQDYCTNNGDDQLESGSSLQERYCSDAQNIYGTKFKYVSGELITCPNGCKDGACQKEPTLTCTDSDGGIDITKKGYVQDSSGIHYDFCSDTKKVGEKVCLDGKMSIKYLDCLEGYSCNDGACSISESCTDSDGGENVYKKGTTTGKSLSYTNHQIVSKTDFCVTGGASNNELVEFYCKDGYVKDMEVDTKICPNGCKDGACVILDTECFDSDNGVDIYTKGYVKDSTGVHNDFCSDSKKIGEKVCRSGKMEIQYEDCPPDYSCKDGVCVYGTITYERIKLNEPFKITLKESKTLENNIKVQFIGIGPNFGVVLKFSLQSLYTNGIMSGIDLQLEKEKKVEYGGYYIELLGLSGETASIIIAKSEMVKESVKCIFKNSDNEEKCYTAEQNSRSSCSGIASCTNDISGYTGEKITWKSSCGGYSSTKIDGVNEEITFDCSKGESDIGKIKDKGFRYMYYKCYNGKEEKQGSESSCKSSESWQGYAKEACNNQCNEESGKCGVNSFSVHGDCYDDTIKNYDLVSCENRDVQECCNEWAVSNSVVIPECVGGWNIKYDKCYFSCKEGEEIIPKEALVCKDSCPLDDKCYQFGYRKSSKYCTDKGSFEEQLPGDKSCENNFECKSNVCVSGNCVSQGMIEKILAWFRNIFGKDE